MRPYPHRSAIGEAARRPTFDGDDDPRRWRWGGQFEQLPSAIIAVIKTDQGITGFGMGAGGSAAVEIIDGHLKHLLMGANALNVEQLWDQMYSSGVLYGRRGVFAMALSAVDNALWDIAGKHAGQPVHELLGGASRDRIPIYQSGGDIAQGKANGVRNFKRFFQVGPHTPQAQLDRAIDRVLRARDTLGADGNLMIDCVSRNGTVEWALPVAERLRPANLYFMEELLSPDDVFGYAELVRRIGGDGPGWTKVACGEHEYTEHGFDVLVRLKSAEVLQPDITWCGGTTAGRRIARLVEAAGLEIIPHRGGQLLGVPNRPDLTELHHGGELPGWVSHSGGDVLHGRERRGHRPDRAWVRHQPHGADGAGSPPNGVRGTNVFSLPSAQRLQLKRERRE